jgi:L-ascorbate metabolism protein UlaG (beta-lactamase superfamily)
MSRRFFLQKLLTGVKSMFLMSALPSFDIAGAIGPDTEPDSERLHYRPLNGLNLRELALKKVHHGDGIFLNPLGIRRKRRFWRLITWKLFSENRFKKALDDQEVRPVSVNWDSVRVHRGLSVTFLKHASLLIKDIDQYLLLDPVFSDIFFFIKDYTPLGFEVETIPKPDQILISHGHYDHLDLSSLSRLDKKTPVLSPLGYEEEFKELDMHNRTRMDWFDTVRQGDREITFLPSNHWTMRNPIIGPNRSLWGSYLIRTASGYTVYLSCDTAYFDGFDQIGREFDIDLAVINLGAYEPRWFMAPSHLNPAETVEAFKALGAKKLMIAHWGTFRLGDEPVHYPPIQLRALLEKEGLAGSWIDVKHGQTYFAV